jgi:pilus assembly protein CpaB
MRGLAIEFDEGTALVGGMIHSNDYVDVLFTSWDRRDGSRTESLTMRLLEGVRVLAVRNGGDPSNDRTQPQVTLEVTESEVNMLTLARHHGAIALSLNPNGRERGGIAISNSERITLEELLGAKPAERPIATDLYRGSRRATNQFRGDSRFVEHDPARIPDQYLPRFSRDANPALKSVPNPPATPVPPADDHEPMDESPPPTAARILNLPK